MKKSALVILFTISSSLTFAGGTGGGGVLSRIGGPVTIGNGTGILKTEYVKYLEEDRGELTFEYGQVNQKNEIYTTKYKSRIEEIKSVVLTTAILDSRASNEWRKLQ